MLNIGIINDGIVLDHIAAGGAMHIYSYLHLEKSDYTVAIIKNAKSNLMGKKDIIKIEGDCLQKWRYPTIQEMGIPRDE